MQVLENTSMENASTVPHRWKTHVRKMQVRIHTRVHHAVQVLNTAYTGTKHSAGSCHGSSFVDCSMWFLSMRLPYLRCPVCRGAISTTVPFYNYLWNSSDFSPDFRFWMHYQFLLYWFVCLFVCLFCHCKITAYVGDNKLILILSYLILDLQQFIDLSRSFFYSTLQSKELSPFFISLQFLQMLINFHNISHMKSVALDWHLE